MGARVVVRREAGLWAYERALARAGLAPVAGADEAGRGACAGPLVVAAAVLPGGRRGEVPGLADSKLLTAAARDRVYDEVMARVEAMSVIVIPAGQVDRRGLHQSNLAGMRQALATLSTRPSYVLTDGFPVAGLGAPGLAVWKGDRVAACIAAASVIAKVTRDRIMIELHERFPAYGFDEHKGYSTPEHHAALVEHGPCHEHRFSYRNVLPRGGELAGRRLARDPRALVGAVLVGGATVDEGAVGAGSTDAGLVENGGRRLRASHDDRYDGEPAAQLLSDSERATA